MSKNSLNSIILPFIYITMSYSHLLILLVNQLLNQLVILVSSLIKICHLHNISLLFLNHASTIFMTQDVFVIVLIKLLHAPLLFLLFILKLTIVTLFYSIYLLHKRIVFNLSLTLLLVLSLKLLNFHHITPILKSLQWLKINERIKCKVLSLTYESLKTGQPSYLRSLLSFPSHRCTRSSSLITLSRPSLTSRLKIAN